MVPITRNPITAIKSITQSELVICSELGIIMIWSNFYIYEKKTNLIDFLIVAKLKASINRWRQINSIIF
jgi:hypothetical protein